mmetsp:Transcript_106797/g.341087  ORF Transcript_106797/g.341087 Transcript_106797/m.341087 type:complete len:250 (+) Transcript_106797:1776-2525(+)
MHTSRLGFHRLHKGLALEGNGHVQRPCEHVGDDVALPPGQPRRQSQVENLPRDPSAALGEGRCDGPRDAGGRTADRRPQRLQRHPPRLRELQQPRGGGRREPGEEGEARGTRPDLGPVLGHLQAHRHGRVEADQLHKAGPQSLVEAVCRTHTPLKIRNLRLKDDSRDIHHLHRKVQTLVVVFSRERPGIRDAFMLPLLVIITSHLGDHSSDGSIVGKDEAALDPPGVDNGVRLRGYATHNAVAADMLPL